MAPRPKTLYSNQKRTAARTSQRRPSADERAARFSEMVDRRLHTNRPAGAPDGQRALTHLLACRGAYSPTIRRRVQEPHDLPHRPGLADLRREPGGRTGRRALRRMQCHAAAFHRLGAAARRRPRRAGGSGGRAVDCPLRDRNQVRARRRRAPPHRRSGRRDREDHRPQARQKRSARPARRRPAGTAAAGLPAPRPGYRVDRPGTPLAGAGHRRARQGRRADHQPGARGGQGL